MKKCLKNKNIKLLSKNMEVKFKYSNYIKACELIKLDIEKKYNLEKENIGILGIARGGLPLLTTMSHFLNIREVSMIQLKMSNSDNCHDYGKVRIVSEDILDCYDKFIIFEDIIFKGKSTDATIDILKSKGKEVIEVYSLVIDEDFKNIEISNSNVNINYVYEINKNEWVYFFWETDITKI